MVESSTGAGVGGKDSKSTGAGEGSADGSGLTVGAPVGSILWMTRSIDVLV